MAVKNMKTFENHQNHSCCKLTTDLPVYCPTVKVVFEGYPFVFPSTSIVLQAILMFENVCGHFLKLAYIWS